MLKTIWNKIKRNPVRALTWTLSAILAVLGFAGVDTGDLGTQIGTIVVLLGGGEVARANVTPVRKPRRR